VLGTKLRAMHLLSMHASTTELYPSPVVSYKAVLSYKLPIKFFGIYTNELKTYNPTKIYTQILIATLSIIDKLKAKMFLKAHLFIIPTNWKKPRCLSIGEWINCDIFIK
jgi:hypothetical protein